MFPSLLAGSGFCYSIFGDPRAVSRGRPILLLGFAPASPNCSPHHRNKAFSRGVTAAILGTLRSDDGDANENVKKEIGLITKTTILHVHHTFFVHFFAFTARLEDVKMRNFKLYRGSTQATTKFPLYF